MPAILVKPARRERHGSDKERTKKDIPTVTHHDSGRIFYIPGEASKQTTFPYVQSRLRGLHPGLAAELSDASKRASASSGASGEFSMSTLVQTSAPARARSVALSDISPGAAFGAFAALIGGAALVGAIINPREAALNILCAALRLVLYPAAFGFTSAWRVFIADRRGEGLLAQMVMLAIATVLFFPVLASGSLFGQPVTGNVSPLGTSVLVGAFMFGLGMQLGGGCASGTLYTVGGGSTRMVITLAAFVAGSAIGAAHFHWWAAQPSFAPVSLVKLWGP